MVFIQSLWIIRVKSKYQIHFDSWNILYNFIRQDNPNIILTYYQLVFVWFFQIKKTLTDIMKTKLDAYDFELLSFSK